jgi:tetratricopeptide (TPR) repeat protein
MVMGSLFFRRWVELAFLIALAFTFAALRLVADDQIIKNDGNVVSGRIVGASDGQVTIESRSSNGGIAKFPITITDIKSISMGVPADVTQAEAPGVAPDDVIAALEPEVKQFAGLPATWVVEAMAALGDAYAAAGKSDRALAVYNQISQLYSGSAYENVAAAGKAKLNLKAGKIDEALAAVQPIVDRANKDIAPSPSDGALYANAFLVYGQVLEAQKKPQQALEAYLTVKTMFYQNPNLVDQANELAKNLRDQNPGLGIE